MTYAIDAVLRDAVAAGDVPNVVATAADRDGPIYEGAAGPRTAGQEDPVTPDTPFRFMSLTKMLATVAALQQVEAGRLDLDAPVERYCPSFAEVLVLEGFDGETPKLRQPASKGNSQAAAHPYDGAGLLVLERGHRQVGGRHRDAERAGRGGGQPHRADAGRSRHHLRVRDQRRLAGQGGRGGRRGDPRRRHQGRHHRPPGMGQTATT
jgi:Beta-lactamase